MKLSEDWQVTFIGLAIVFIVSLGIFGKGGQTHTLQADPSATTEKILPASSGWSVSATLGTEKLETIVVPTTTGTGETYFITCEAGKLTLKDTSTLTLAPPTDSPNDALIVLENACSEPITLTYKLASIFRVPLFGWWK